MDDKTFNQLFELRFASKQLQKASTKAEKKSEQTKKQVAQYLQKGNGKNTSRSTIIFSYFMVCLFSISSCLHCSFLILPFSTVEAARLYAENAIRHKNEALHYLRLSAKLDGSVTIISHLFCDSYLLLLFVFFPLLSPSSVLLFCC